jgi:hypothetical protein
MPMRRVRRCVTVIALVMVPLLGACGTTANPRPGQEGDGGVSGTAPLQTTNHTQDPRGEFPVERETGNDPNLPPTPDPVFPNP